jgi:hypothetical protein
MANATIPSLPQAIALTGAEQMEAVQAGTSVRLTSLQIANLGGPTGPPGAGPTGPIGPTGPSGGGPTSASAVNYTPPFTGSVTETVAAKLAQTVSVFDFMTTAQIANVQANLGTIDLTAVVTAAAAASKLVIFPGGAYLISSTPTIPLDVVLETQPGSTFSGAGSTALNLNILSSFQYNVVEGDIDGAGFRNVHSTAHTYGGSTMTGGRNSFAVQSSLNATSSAGNTNRNYVAGLFQFNGNVNDNGTNPTSSGTSAGAGFGLNPVAILANGATSWLNLSGMEVNIACQTGSSVFARTGIQISELVSSTVQGAIFDAAISLTNQGGVGWQNGLLFNAESGSHPVTATGNLIAAQGAHTVQNGVNFTAYTFTGQSFSALGFSVQGGGTEIDLGLIGAANTYRANFHTGASAAPNYDSRIVASGGTGTNGGGSLVVNSSALGFFSATSGTPQATGYGTPTGGSHQASFAAGSISLPNLAAAVAQLIVDLKAYSLIGA